MSDWNSDLYLKFEKERTQPAIDLASRIGFDAAKSILDCCGPGNSTAFQFPTLVYKSAKSLNLSSRF